MNGVTRCIDIGAPDLMKTSAVTDASNLSFQGSRLKAYHSIRSSTVPPDEMGVFEDTSITTPCVPIDNMTDSFLNGVAFNYIDKPIL
jgi:hypothetical protein